MKKIICDACGKEILGEIYQAITAYSQKSRIDGKGYGKPNYLLEVQLHPECAKVIEDAIRGRVNKLCKKRSEQSK